VKTLQKNRQASPQLILASTSPYRASLFDQLGLAHLCVPPDYEEAFTGDLTAAELASKFAEGKARSLQNQYCNHIIVGSDQTAEHDQQILTKPGTRAKAIEQLLSCSNETVYFYTAVSVLNTRSLRLQSVCKKVSVTFRVLTRQETERYLNKENALDCCGSFKIEGLGISLLRAVTSDDPTSLIGLPLIALSNMLRNEGFQIP
jgi:septum formation protein